MNQRSTNQRKGVSDRRRSNTRHIWYGDRRIGSPDRRQRESKHTPACLAKRLMQLEPILRRQFRPLAADHGIDAARDAGLRYIERVRAGKAEDLADGFKWLLRVATRASVKFKSREPPSISIELVTPIAPTPQEGGREWLGRVSEALNQLPDKQKRSMIYCIVEGLSLREAAREMRIAHQTVNNHLIAGKAKLQELLQSFEKSARS